MVDRQALGRRRGVSCGGQAGFSLVELLIALVVSSATLGAAVVLTGKISRGYTTQLDTSAIQDEARYALELVENALLPAGSNPYNMANTCPGGGTPFQGIQPDPNGNAILDDVRIQCDARPNGQLCGEPGEDITIAHDAAARTITFQDNGVGGPVTPLTDSVISLLRFTYLDANRVVTVNPAAITFVQIAVTAQAANRDQDLGQATQYTLTSEVRVRAR